MARPLTKDESTAIKREFLVLLELNKGQRYMTAKEMKIPYATVQYWVANDKEFEKAVADIWELNKDKKVKELMERDSDACLIYFIKTQCKDRGFVERFETTGRDGGPIESKTESIITQNTIPLAQNILKDYEKVILNGKDKPSESTASKPH